MIEVSNFRQRSSRVYAINRNRMRMQTEYWILTSKKLKQYYYYFHAEFLEEILWYVLNVEFILFSRFPQESQRTLVRPHCQKHVSLWAVIPYGQKFSRDPIFAEGPSSKISRFNFRGWTFQGCSTYNIRPAPPLTARSPWLKSRWNQPASDRSIVLVLSREREMARE